VTDERTGSQKVAPDSRRCNSPIADTSGVQRYFPQHRLAAGIPPTNRRDDQGKHSPADKTVGYDSGEYPLRAGSGRSVLSCPARHRSRMGRSFRIHALFENPLPSEKE